jgi:hypothetical protein
VGVGKDKIQIGGFFVGQIVPQAANPGARIHHNNIVALGPDFHTGRVTAVLQVFFA